MVWSVTEALLDTLFDRTGQLPTLATLTANSSFTPFGLEGIGGIMPAGIGGAASGHAIGLASATAALPTSNAMLTAILIFSQWYLCNDCRVPKNKVRGGP
jgi:hypothetical protein